MRYVLALAGLLLMLYVLAVDVQARRVTLGTISLDTPNLHYGDWAAFSWTLDKRPMRPTLGVLCRQAGDTGTTYRFIAELGIPRERSGSGSIRIGSAYTQPTGSPPLDETQPATCQASVWDELGNGQQPVVLTPWITFGVAP